MPNPDGAVLSCCAVLYLSLYLLISPQSITTGTDISTGHEDKGNDRQRRNVSMFKQIPPTTTIRNIWRTVIMA